MHPDPEALDLKQIAGILRRRLPMVVLCVVVVAGAAFAFSKHQTKKYTATAAVVFNNNQLSQTIVGLPANSGGVSLQAEQASDLELVKLGDMAAKTASVLGHGLTEQQVHASVSVAGQGESGIIDVSATASSPALAAEIANTYSQQFTEEQKNAKKQYFKSALALVHKQLAALSPRQRTGADGLQLQDREQTLGLLAELKPGNVQVAQEAAVPTSPSSPKTSRNTAFGIVLGLFIGIALAFILESLKRPIRAPEDLEAIYRRPLLGTVPESRALARKGVALPLAEAEAFGLIRAHLRFFNIDRDLHAVAIASAAAGDGKTTIARYLAEAAARSGSRVLLLELDLRQPTVAAQLDIQAGPGAADVLIGTTSMQEATRSVNVGGVADGEGAMGRTLDVLVAGAVLPPNPSELLESHAVDKVLEQASSVYDLVVIDTPPLACVPDAFPLLTKVDGVVIVGWVERSRRDAAERLQRILDGSGVRLLGVIANGAKSGGPGLYPGGSMSSPAKASASEPSPSAEITPTARV